MSQKKAQQGVELHTLAQEQRELDKRIREGQNGGAVATPQVDADKIKADHASEIDKLKEGHQSQLDAKDAEIEQLKAALEEAKTAKTEPEPEAKTKAK